MALPLSTAPIDFLIDPATNDLVIKTDLFFSSGIQAILQSCRIILQMFQGEWFLDLDLGIPYWQNIFGQKPGNAMQAAYVAYRAALLGVNGVTGVLSLNISYDGATRTMNVAFQVQTQFGDTPPDSIALAVSGGNALSQATSGTTVGGL